jgi:4-hydroxyphenylacetate 3-monooxygenase
MLQNQRFRSALRFVLDRSRDGEHGAKANSSRAMDQTMQTARSGQGHIDSLKDGRDVSIEGAHVADVTTHRAFRNAVRSAARLYDFQAEPAHIEAMTFVSPDRGLRVSRCWQLPKSDAELVERRRALEAWAGLHYGFMGRSPDHVASCIGGMYMGLDLFEAYDRKRAAAVHDYYRFARDNDLFLTYVIINPQADRSKAAHAAQADPFLAAGVVDEDAEGLTIRGGKMLGTSGINGERGVRHLHPAALPGRREAGGVVRGTDERQGAAGAVAEIL